MQFTLSAYYTRSSKQTLCVGLEVDKTEAMIRNRYNRIPHPALNYPLNTKRERDTHNEDGPKTKTAQAKKAKEYSKSEGKKESRAYDELLQVKWPKEVAPPPPPPVFSHRINTEKVIERSRVCHNHKPQPTLDTKKKENGQKHKRAKQTNICTRSTKTSSLFPKRGDQNAKTNGETRTKSIRRL